MAFRLSAPNYSWIQYHLFFLSLVLSISAAVNNVISGPYSLVMGTHYIVLLLCSVVPFVIEGFLDRSLYRRRTRSEQDLKASQSSESLQSCHTGSSKTLVDEKRLGCWDTSDCLASTLVLGSVDSFLIKEKKNPTPLERIPDIPGKRIR